MYINSFGQVKGKLFQVSEYDLCLKGAKSDTFYLKGFAVPVICAPLSTVNDRLSPRGLICQNDFLGSIFKV